MRTRINLIIGLSVIAFLGGCKKNDSTPSYTVPGTYNFTNADSLPAKTALSMLAEIEAVINKGNTANTVVSAAQLKSMFSNQGGYFTDTVFSGFTLHLNTSGLQLKSNTLSAAQVYVETIFDSIGIASQSVLPASNGVAGVSSRKTLLSANGVYWRQFFTKSLMGVLLAHQITDVYLTDSLNANISSATKQHAWDQAFFLWCVPANFPANRTNVKYWGSYSSQIDSGVVKPVVNLTGINSNPTLLKAFLTGRAALANNDNATAQAQASIIIAMFEKMEAAAALHELNEAKGNIPNGAAAVAGNLSESMGFWMALKFNTKRKIISEAQVNTILAMYGTNFYNITQVNIDNIQNAISAIYGWDAVKSFL
jgi:Domain of unknown function (DUF4856)